MLCQLRTTSPSTAPRLSLWKLWIQRNAWIISWTWSPSLSESRIKHRRIRFLGETKAFLSTSNSFNIFNLTWCDATGHHIMTSKCAWSFPSSVTEIKKKVTLKSHRTVFQIFSPNTEAKLLRCRPCHTAPLHPLSRSSKASLRSSKLSVSSVSRCRGVGYLGPKKSDKFLSQGIRGWEFFGVFESWRVAHNSGLPPSCSQGSEKRSYLTHGIQAALLARNCKRDNVIGCNWLLKCNQSAIIWTLLQTWDVFTDCSWSLLLIWNPYNCPMSCLSLTKAKAKVFAFLNSAPRNLSESDTLIDHRAAWNRIKEDRLSD